MEVLKQSICATVAAVTLMLPSSLQAQTVSSSFSDLPNALRQGQEIIVADQNGRTTKGHIVDLRDSFITVTVRDGWNLERRRFDQSDITTIRRTDPVWNGLLLGLGAGLVAAEVWTRSECGPPGRDRECSVIVRAVGWSTMVPGGAITGALIDKFTNTLVYRSPRRRTTVRLSPTFGYPHTGISVSLAF